VSGTQFNVFGSGVLTNLNLTGYDAIGNGYADYADNDAQNVAGLAELTIITQFSGNNNHNYDIGFSPLVALANDGLILSATKKAQSVLLKWTYEGTGYTGFEVERSANGKNFITIGTVSKSAVGFEFIDENPLKGANHYRIRVLKSGPAKYSNNQVVSFAGLTEASVYPNPASTQLTVSLKNIKAKQLSVVLYSQNGNAILQKNYPAQTGNTSININGMNQFSNGLYIIKISDGNEIVLQQKIIILH